MQNSTLTIVGPIVQWQVAKTIHTPNAGRLVGFSSGMPQRKQLLPCRFHDLESLEIMEGWKGDCPWGEYHLQNLTEEGPNVGHQGDP